MAVNANFAATPRAGTATVSSANTAYDGSGTIATVLTAGATGTRIDQVIVAATGTVAAGQVALFISDTNAANTTANTHFIRGVSVTATAASATTAAFNSTLTSQTNPDLLPIFLPSGYTLRASTTIAQSLKVMAIGADF